jgi:uroporphyrin-3 C-methyltransferase
LLQRQQAVNALAANQQQALTQRLTTTERQLAAERQQVSRLANELSQTQQQLTGLQSRLQKIQQRLAGWDTNDANKWTIAEVEYRLRLAQQRLALARDIPGAVALITAADHLLAELQDPFALTLRQQLQQDLAALQTVPRVDITGTYLRLQSLQQQITHLPLPGPDTLLKQGEPVTKDAANAPASHWYQRLWASFGQLRRYVRIRQLDEPVKPLLSPQQKDYLRFTLSLKLEQAQTALLDGQKQIFANSIKGVEQLLTQYYDPTNPVVKHCLTQVQQLAQLNIRPELPSIARTLALAQDYMQAHHLRLLESTGNSEADGQTTGEPQ